MGHLRQRDRQPTRSELLRLARSSVELARSVPELVPAFTWLLAAGGRSDLVKAYRILTPTVEELAALAVCMGGPVWEILSHKKRLSQKVKAVDVAHQGLFAIRAAALRRIGLGIESMIDL